MSLLPRAWSGGRNMETYTYNDRQVVRLVMIALCTGVFMGAAIASLLHFSTAN